MVELENRLSVINQLEETVRQLRQQNSDLTVQLNRFINTNEEIEKFEGVPSRERRQILADNRVAFMAALGSNLAGLPDYATVVFDYVMTNIGNAYQPATGIFTAPVKGVYTFTLTFMVEPGHREYVELAVDGRMIGTNVLAAATQTHDYESTTRQWVIELIKGAQVLIRTSNFENEGFIHAAHTVWSGFLLFEME